MGEISPSEFKDFIGENIRLEPVLFNDQTDLEKVLAYYMGKNSQDRQDFIIDNLRLEKDQPFDQNFKEEVLETAG